jgi:hypothetical protein
MIEANVEIAKPSKELRVAVEVGFGLAPVG